MSENLSEKKIEQYLSDDRELRAAQSIRDFGTTREKLLCYKVKVRMANPEVNMTMDNELEYSLESDKDEFSKLKKSVAWMIEMGRF